MIITKIKIDDLTKGVYTPKNTFTNIKPKLTKGKPLKIPLNTLQRGTKLNIDIKYKKEANLESNILLDKLNLRKGIHLSSVGSLNLTKGTSLKIGNLFLSDGNKLNLILGLVKGKKLTLKKDNLYNTISKTIDKEAKKDEKVIRDIDIVKEDINKNEISVNSKEQKRENTTLEQCNVIKKDTKLDNIAVVEDGVIYNPNMSLYDFLKENPKKRTEDIILKYYSFKDLKGLIDSGKVLKKRGKLII